MRLAIYEPDIPQNTGALLRLANCMGIHVDIIEPCGFIWTNRHLKRVGMDYIGDVPLVRHKSWRAFRTITTGRIVLLTTTTSVSFIKFAFQTDDILLCGRESSGVPQSVHNIVTSKVKIPMSHNSRSMNVVVAAAIVLSEALRQTDGYPTINSSTDQE